MIKLTKKQRELLEKHIDEDNWSFRSDQERAVAFIRREICIYSGYVCTVVLYGVITIFYYKLMVSYGEDFNAGFSNRSVKRTVGKRLQTLYKESKIKRSQEKFYAMIKSDFLM